MDRSRSRFGHGVINELRQRVYALPQRTTFRMSGIRSRVHGLVAGGRRQSVNGEVLVKIHTVPVEP